MVTHQHPGVNAPARHATRLTQRPEEQLSVVIAAEDLLPAIPPRHDVVKGTGMLNANAAWHTVRLIRARVCQELMPDPYFPYALGFTQVGKAF